MHVYFNIAIAVSSRPSKKCKSYFGTKVEVKFDDGKQYPGVIIGKEAGDAGHWITRFEDGTEDTCIDPSIDKDYKIIP